MFDGCAIMVIDANDETNIMRLDIDEATQKDICVAIFASVTKLTQEKTKVEFDGSYKPNQDEFLSISNFQLPDEIKDAVRDPLGAASYKKRDGKYPEIKALFIGKRMEKNEDERFIVAFQRFRNAQYISTSNINLFFNSYTLRREKNFGISISNCVDCYYTDEELQFASFYFARQVLHLGEYYRSATDQEVVGFASDEHLKIEDVDGFKKMANTAIRKKIAMINDSEVLKKYSPSEIRGLAKHAGIEIIVENKRIVIPNDKEQIKLILGFLDEEAYRGPFSQNVYLANSKRTISKN